MTDWQEAYFDLVNKVECECVQQGDLVPIWDQFKAMSAELAKFKALAETLATDLRECARALQSLHQIPGTGADGRLRQRIKKITDAAHAAVAQYKEARDVE